MKINPISVCQPRNNYRQIRHIVPQTLSVPEEQNPTIAFKGKHDCAKFLGGLCGVLGTAGAVGGFLIMTGGLGAAALPWIAGYGALSAGTGALIGHDIDKSAKDSDKK